ncbi:sulfite reductase subunit alpha [Vineibacter terrae]|uniref:assimilatory sulfite reductase (NADPH) n=1 Tax=Vineibacter terrae TaxID=2586908 RepID=A0A5C8PD35_9HYPH|nr:sulfite reductase subunit alpha [Vineibacter terrae]TXL71515.1 sulfite reductase subunit alpha [Vineibacter terrae]
MTYLAPIIPDNAPFSPQQRAWLNGLLAGLLSPGTSGTAPSATISVSAPADDPHADFPWHDPGLDMDERQKLAEGRPLQQRLMAAMAQMDCGQCGYECRTYAEAIATGSETSLGKCQPGGKATARMLKTLMEAAGSGDAATPAAPAAVPGPAAAPVAGRSEVRDTVLRQALRLNGGGSDKDTRHVVLETDLAYEPGDSLGVHVSNPADEVDEIIALLRADPTQAVRCPDGRERPLRAALMEAVDIAQPSDLAIETLAAYAKGDDADRLQALAEGYPGAEPTDADLLDLLAHFPSTCPPVAELIPTLAGLQPRLYSIASSPRHEPGTVHLCVGTVRYRKRRRNRRGIASTFLAERAACGTRVPAFIQHTRDFRLPGDDVPIIMIGPGTGIAPFRAFLQDRRARGATGRNWLFFGDQRRATDFLFENELVEWTKDGLLTRLDTAFSRDQEDKVYVQHRMREAGKALYGWLQEGAHLYVCGDAQRMAKDVDVALTLLAAREGGMSQGAAKAWMADLACQHRYLRDVY